MGTPKDTVSRLRVLRDTLDAVLAEGRALRHRLELLCKAREISVTELRLAGQTAHYLDLRHANRVF